MSQSPADRDETSGNLAVPLATFLIESFAAMLFPRLANDDDASLWAEIEVL